MKKLTILFLGISIFLQNKNVFAVSSHGYNLNQNVIAQANILTVRNELQYKIQILQTGIPGVIFFSSIPIGEQKNLDLSFTQLENENGSNGRHITIVIKDEFNSILECFVPVGVHQIRVIENDGIYTIEN